ncbi:MAG: hypothetical protein LBB86_10710, partial [Oscillospiraceae bacterium]|nr:hypothetical protein [Oscillospiraceae bacterium]
MRLIKMRESLRDSADTRPLRVGRRYREAWRGIGLVIGVALAILAGACAVQPPQRIDGYITPAPTIAATVEPQPETPTAEPDTADPPSATDSPAPPSVPTDSVGTVAAFATKTIGRVEIFYPGMSSMMGFVDAPITTIYENTMEAIAASV